MGTNHLRRPALNVEGNLKKNELLKNKNEQ